VDKQSIGMFFFLLGRLSVSALTGIYKSATRNEYYPVWYLGALRITKSKLRFRSWLRGFSQASVVNTLLCLENFRDEGYRNIESCEC
jgi:hypothetical protein